VRKGKKIRYPEGEEGETAREVRKREYRKEEQQIAVRGTSTGQTWKSR